MKLLKFAQINLVNLAVFVAVLGCAEQDFKSGSAGGKKNNPDKGSDATPSQKPQSDSPSDMIQTDQGTIDCKKSSKGKIIVSNDEWAFSEAGMAAAPDAKQYAKNVAVWLGGCEGRGYGKFHAYSNNFSLTAPSLAKEFSDVGHTWSSGFSIDLTPEGLSQYDWIFLAGPVPDIAKLVPLLVDFVQKGGGLYISAGTLGNAAVEAGWWNPVIQRFGMQYASGYNGIKGNININESLHPIFKGVKQLYQNNGNSISLVAPLSPKTKIYVSSGSQGLYAIYDGGKSD
ncbi:MAG: hypothetical protein NT027_14490 [Proteobacteria bacterium]|nr:hypothetical protein [Pseudomonadota bacterium]